MSAKQRFRIRFFASFIVALAALFAAAPASEAASDLHIFTWTDYFDSDVVNQFQRQYKCQVWIDYFESNEAMLAALVANDGGYDIITPSSYMSGIMRGRGMLLDIDHGKIPNLANIDVSFTRMTGDPEMRFSVPYTRTVSGVSYDSKRVPESATGGWDIFANAAFRGKMTMLDDMRETLGAALKHLGHSLNSVDKDELAAAGGQVAEWKANLAGFSVDEAKAGIRDGVYAVTHSYNGDAALVMTENPDIRFYIPKEGSSITSDDFVIGADTPVPELAHAFINHMLDIEMARLNMESVRYYMPVPEAVGLLDPELRLNPAFNVPPEVIGRCEVIRDVGDALALYEREWEALRGSD